MFDGFGEVRGALHGAPSEERWWELCAVLDRMGGAHLATRVLPYVSESLARWPDRLRMAPANWVDRLLYAGRCDLVTCERGAPGERARAAPRDDDAARGRPRRGRRRPGVAAVLSR